VLKLVVFLVAACVFLGFANGRLDGSDVGAAGDAVARAYDDARAALALVREGVDARTRRELEDARVQLAEATAALEEAGAGADLAGDEAVASALRRLQQLERKIDAVLG
jgi:hypothetical protein